jgi:hypothetical protein
MSQARAEIVKLADAFKPSHGLKLKPKDEKALTKLAKSAYLWNDKVNTRFFGHDFHPCIFKFDERFNSKEMELKSWVGTRNIQKTGRIFASVGLGLKSSVARGPSQKPEEVWQAKVPIVAVAHMV